MHRKKVLVIGGTGLGRQLAERLQGHGFEVVLSLAGVTRVPLLPDVPVRKGGFGGSNRLATYLMQEKFSAIADAAHPFAATISGNAADAAASMDIPIVRLEVAPWQASQGDRWFSVTGTNEAAVMLPAGARVLLTTGRRNLKPFLSRANVSGIVRCIEPPEEEVRPPWRLLLARPPFAFKQEKELLAHEAITTLVAKNSGGEAMRAKLDAAQALGIAVMMIGRPEKPPVETVATVDNAVRWLKDLK